MTTFLMPFCAAQSAIGTVACGRVKLVRTMKGEASVIIEVAAAMTTCGTLACVASGAVARASGVRPKPARTVDLVVDDQLLRDALGDVGDAGVVLDDQLDLLAGDRVAVLLHVELAPPPRSGGRSRRTGPVIGRIRPIFTVSCAIAAPLSASMAAAAPTALNKVRLNMSLPPSSAFSKPSCFRRGCAS